VEEATRLLRETPIMHHPANMLVADAGCRLAVVENSPVGFAVRDPDAGLLYATNHFCAAGMRGTDCPPSDDLKANTHARMENLARRTRSTEPSLEGVRTILADHHQPGAVCQHGHAGMWTVSAFIAVPARRSLWFANGRPCETAFGEYRL
jgi:hypothetical protein